MRIWFIVSYSTTEFILLLALKLVGIKEAEDWALLVNSHVFKV